MHFACLAAKSGLDEEVSEQENMSPAYLCTNARCGQLEVRFFTEVAQQNTNRAMQCPSRNVLTQKLDERQLLCNAPRKERFSTVVLCLANPGEYMTPLESMAEVFQMNPLIHLQTSVKFTRWLFQQPRGDITPQTQLVVGWREAKPCVSAIMAARTGCTEGLRPDDRRPQLNPICESPKDGGRVKVAVQTVIILLETSKQRGRTVAWAKGFKDDLDIDIHVARNTAHLQMLVGSLSNGQDRRGSENTLAGRTGTWV